MKLLDSILPKVIVAAALAMIAAASQAQERAQEWTFAVTPYLWLPNVEAGGTTESPPNSGARPEFEVGPVDYLEHLDFVLMLAGEARRGNWVLRADMVYVDFGNERAVIKTISGPGGVVERPLNASTTSSISGLEVQASLGFQVVNDSNLSVEVLGGIPCSN